MYQDLLIHHPYKINFYQIRVWHEWLEPESLLVILKMLPLSWSPFLSLGVKMSPQTSYFWKNPTSLPLGFQSSHHHLPWKSPGVSHPVSLFVSVTQETQESQLVIIWTISSYGTAEPISLTFSVSGTLSSTAVLHQPNCLSPQCLLGRLCEAFALADIQLSPKDTASLKTLYVLAVILPPLGLEVGGVRPLCLPSPRKPQLWSSCLDCPTCYSLSHPTSFLQTIIPGPLLHVMELKLHLCVCVYNFYIFWYPGLVVFDLLSSNEHVLFLKIILYDCQQQQLFHHLSYKHLISSFSLIWLFNWFI